MDRQPRDEALWVAFREEGQRQEEEAGELVGRLPHVQTPAVYDALAAQLVVARSLALHCQGEGHRYSERLKLHSAPTGG